MQCSILVILVESHRPRVTVLRSRRFLRVRHSSFVLIEIFDQILIFVLDGFSLQFQCISDESSVRRPIVFDHLNTLRAFEPFDRSLLTHVLHLFADLNIELVSVHALQPIALAKVFLRESLDERETTYC